MAVYKPGTDECKCLDPTMLFDSLSLKCFTLTNWIAASNCGSGQYKVPSTTTCSPCRSNDAGGLCTACAGSNPADCISCPSGYFLNKKTYSCDACPSGCE